MDAFLDDGEPRRLHKGDVLARAGERVEYLSVVLDGSLEVSTITQAGKRHVLRYLEPGQIFNLIPVLDEQPAIHDAVAHVDTVLLVLSRPLILRALDTDPAFVHAVLRILCLRSRMSYFEISHGSALSLRQRCVAALLALSDPYGIPRGSEIAISLKLSQDELADMVGASRPMVNRELKRLEREQIIKTSYSQFVIADLPALRRIAEK